MGDNNMLAVSGLVVGAVGDVGLQLADKYGYGNEGLKDYYAIQGPVVSVAKAALLTGGWSWAYTLLDPSPSLPRFMAFTGLVDVVYRYAYPWLYPTLDQYYAKNTPMATVLYNVVVGLLVWQFDKYVWV